MQQSEQILAQLEEQEGEGIRGLVDESARVLAEIEAQERRQQQWPQPSGAPWGTGPGAPVGPPLTGPPQTGCCVAPLPQGFAPAGIPLQGPGPVMAPPMPGFPGGQGVPLGGPPAAPVYPGPTPSTPAEQWRQLGAPAGGASAAGEAAAAAAAASAAAFVALDRNHDGVISRAEWAQAQAGAFPGAYTPQVDRYDPDTLYI